jgi:type IV pilus assembly protein PilP
MYYIFNKTVSGSCKYLCLALLPVFLMGCETEQDQALQEWLNKTRSEMRVKRESIPEPKGYAPYVYNNIQNSADPFNPIKLGRPLMAEKEERKNKPLIMPDLKRRKEVLESYALDVIRMVGTIKNHRVINALIQADGVIYQIKVGGYIGSNFGKVTKITETEVYLKELVQDAAGDWEERQSIIQLQETKK